MEFKDEIIQRYTIMLKDRIDVFKDMIAALTEDSKNDAKGSAGDKHETALSMMHLEQEKLNHKLQENIQLLRQFSEIDFTKKSERIVVGSLVNANDFYFLVSVALPKISIEGQTIFSVSPQAPLASKLLGLKINEEVTVNGTTYLVKEVL